MKYHLFTFLFPAYLTFSSLCYAQQTFYVIPDGRPLMHSSELENPTVSSNIVVQSKPGRSFCCDVNSDQGFSSYFSSVKLGVNSVFDSLGVKYRGDEGFLLPNSGTALTGKDRVCLYVSPTVVLGSSASLTLGLAFGANGLSAGNNIQLSCKQTTQVGGFNTYINEFNFLEVTPTGAAGDQNITVWVKALNSSGGQVINTSFTVLTGQRFDLDIHTAAGSSTYGTIFLSHDGSPGSIVAHVSQYKVTSQSPLQFELRTRDRLTLIEP
jgi:hypothetical protein